MLAEKNSTAQRKLGLVGLLCFLGVQRTLGTEDLQRSQWSSEHQAHRADFHGESNGQLHHRQRASTNVTATTTSTRERISSGALPTSGTHATNSAGRAREDLESDTSCDPLRRQTRAETLSDARLIQLTKLAAAAAAVGKKKELTKLPSAARPEQIPATAELETHTSERQSTGSNVDNDRDEKVRQLRWVNGRKVNTPPQLRDRAKSFDGGSEDRTEQQQPTARARPPPGRPPPYRETGMNTVRASLRTVWGEHLANHSRFLPWPKYPRPQLVRKGSAAGAALEKGVSASSAGGGTAAATVPAASSWWLSLNGYWDYSVTLKREAASPTAARALGWAGKIRVPFPFESQLAGVGADRVLEPSQYLWYRRTFRLSKETSSSSHSRTSHGNGHHSGHLSSQRRRRRTTTATSSGATITDTIPPSGTALRYYLNFEAVDYACEVWVNDLPVGGHLGASTPFRLDISDAVAAAEMPGAQNDQIAHELVVRVEDSTSGAQLRGKQALSPRGIWYSRASGIWQAVWLEAVPAVHIAKLKVTPHLFTIGGGSGSKRASSSAAASGSSTQGAISRKANSFAASTVAATSGGGGGSNTNADADGGGATAVDGSGGGVGHGSFVVKVMLDAASPSSLDPNMGGGTFSLSDDDDTTEVFGASHDAQASSAAQSWAAAYPQGQENGTYARPRRQQDDLLRRRRRRLMSSSSPSSSDSSTTSRKPGRRTGKSDKPAAWLPGAKLRAEVEVRAPGALGSGAAGGLRASVPLVVLSVDEPMGIVTRADGEHLLVVGVKAKSQAADAGIKPGAYVTAVGGIDVRTFSDVQAALISVKTLAEKLEAALKDSSPSSSDAATAVPAAGTPGSRYYVLQLTNTVVVARSSCQFQGHGTTTAPEGHPDGMRRPDGSGSGSDSSGGSGGMASIRVTGAQNRAKEEAAFMAAALEGEVSFDTTTSSGPEEPILIGEHTSEGSTGSTSSGSNGGIGGGAWAGPNRNGQSSSESGSSGNLNTKNRNKMSSRPPPWADECVATVVVSQPKLWAPDAPYLYDLKITLYQDLPPALPGLKGQSVMLDEVWSYAGMREVGRARTADGHLRLTLNGQPLFQLGVLDQGWWPDGLLTPPSDAAQVHDMEYLKSAGYNLIRKHAKVENRRYYYHCDRLGMLVWQDHLSGDEDGNARTVLSPRQWTRLAKDHPEEGAWGDANHAQFMSELEAMVDAFEVHPSIVAWVPFNEAWGQHRTVEVATWLTKRDPSRLVNAASGGNFWPVGHMADNHNYPNPLFPFFLPNRPDLEQPMQDYKDFVKVVGEFGGHGLFVPGHTWFNNDPNGAGSGGGLGLLEDPLLVAARNSLGLNSDTVAAQQQQPGTAWAYGGLPTSTGEFKERYRVSLAALRELADQGIAAGVYTQTTDVEGEVNGLLTYDRRVAKVDHRDLREWHTDLFNAAATGA